MKFFRHNILKILIMLAVLVSALSLSGCGNGDFEASNGADYLFVIKANYSTNVDENPIADLLNIPYVFADNISYSVEDESIISISQSGIISSANTTELKTTYVTASYEGVDKKIKVVVAGDYNPEEYRFHDKLYIPYGEVALGNEYSGSTIKYVDIPNTVKTIKDGAFLGCSDLEEAHLPDGLTFLSNDIFSKCSSLKYITIPESVTIIGEAAFKECDALENIELYEGLTNINDFAFYSCGNIKTINIPSTVTFIGQRSFCNCTNLEEITIPDGVTKIYNDTFSTCSNLSKLKLPSTLTSIGEKAFVSCQSLETLTIPNGVTDIGLDAFSGCINIKTINLPASLPIDKSIFPSVAGITNVHFTGSGEGYSYTANNFIYTPWYISRNHRIYVTYDEGVTSIGDYTFARCHGLTQITLPNSLHTICHGAFRKCYNIKSISIPDNVTIIEEYAFSLNYALEEIEFSKNLCSIGYYAFSECTSLKEVNLPDSVTHIGEHAFSGCNAIEKINLGTSSKSNLKHIGVRAFAGFLFNCEEVNIYSTKLKYVASGAFGYVGDEKPAYTIGTLAKESTIYVPNSNIKKLFVADKNYYSNETSIVIR